MHLTHQYSTYGGNDECVNILDATPYGRDLCFGLTREDRPQTGHETSGKNRGRYCSEFFFFYSSVKGAVKCSQNRMTGQFIKNEPRIMLKEWVWRNWKYNCNTLVCWRNRRKIWITWADLRSMAWPSFTYRFTTFLLDKQLISLRSGYHEVVYAFNLRCTSAKLWVDTVVRTFDS